jgi:hypothetical protein
MDFPWQYLWLLVPALLGLYIIGLIFAIHGSVRICRTRLHSVDEQLRELSLKIDNLKEYIKQR